MLARSRWTRSSSLFAALLSVTSCTAAPEAVVTVPVTPATPPVASAEPPPKAAAEPLDPGDEEVEVSGRLVKVGVVTDRVKQQIEALPDHADMVLALRGRVTPAKLATLRKLPWLKELMLPSDLTSLAELDGLPALVELQAPGLKVTSLDVVTRFPALQVLRVYGGRGITDFGAVAQLSKLTKLDASDTGLPSFAPLVKLPLRHLHAMHVPATDVEVLARIPTLESLLLQESGAENFSALSALRNLTFIALDDSRVQDISFAASLPRLYDLHLHACARFSDLRPVARMPVLRTLSIGGTATLDLGPLRGHPTLWSLDISRTKITDIGPVRTLPALSLLAATDTSLVDLRPLAGSSVERLLLENTPVKDLRPLASAAKLQHLDVRRTKVTDLAPLARAKALRKLVVSPSMPVAQLDKLRAALPELKIDVQD